MPTQPIMIADHLALDFMNTSFGVSNPVELLTTDSQVREWLINAGLHGAGEKVVLNAQGELLNDALELRTLARSLVSARKNGALLDINQLNAFLENGAHYYQMAYSADQSLTLNRHRRVSSYKELLTPVAEEIADLLVNANFALIRQCENPECTLWFYDKTKSHQRRWCDMAICGNRMKAAAFRARLKNKSVST